MSRPAAAAAAASSPLPPLSPLPPASPLASPLSPGAYVPTSSAHSSAGSAAASGGHGIARGSSAGTEPQLLLRVICQSRAAIRACSSASQPAATEFLFRCPLRQVADDSRVVLGQLRAAVVQRFGELMQGCQLMMDGVASLDDAENWNSIKANELVHAFEKHDGRRELVTPVDKSFQAPPDPSVLFDGGEYSLLLDEHNERTVAWSLCELVDNSLTAMATNSQRGEPKLFDIRIHDHGNQSFIVVSDNGSGMTPEELEHFARYAFAPSSRGTTKPKLTDEELQVALANNFLSEPSNLYGVGAKQACLFLGDGLTVFTKTSHSPEVHEFEITRAQFQGVATEDLYKARLRNREAGGVAACSVLNHLPHGFTQTLILEELSMGSHWTRVVISLLKPRIHGFFHNKHALVAIEEELASVYHFHLFGKDGAKPPDSEATIETGAGAAAASSSSSVVAGKKPALLSWAPAKYFLHDPSIPLTHLQVYVRRTSGSAAPTSLSCLVHDRIYQHFTSAAERLVFHVKLLSKNAQGLTSEVGVLKGMLLYHPKQREEETNPYVVEQMERAHKEHADAATDDAAVSAFVPSNKVPFFIYWSGRLVPLTTLPDLFVDGKPTKTLHLYGHRLSGVLFMAHCPQLPISRNKLTLGGKLAELMGNDLAIWTFPGSAFSNRVRRPGEKIREWIDHAHKQHDLELSLPRRAFLGANRFSQVTFSNGFTLQPGMLIMFKGSAQDKGYGRFESFDRTPGVSAMEMQKVDEDGSFAAADGFLSYFPVPLDLAKIRKPVRKPLKSYLGPHNADGLKKLQDAYEIHRSQKMFNVAERMDVGWQTAPTGSGEQPLPSALPFPPPKSAAMPEQQVVIQNIAATGTGSGSEVAPFRPPFYDVLHLPAQRLGYNLPAQTVWVTGHANSRGVTETLNMKYDVKRLIKRATEHAPAETYQGVQQPQLNEPNTDTVDRHWDQLGGEEKPNLGPSYSLLFSAYEFPTPGHYAIRFGAFGHGVARTLRITILAGLPTRADASWVRSPGHEIVPELQVTLGQPVTQLLQIRLYDAKGNVLSMTRQAAAAYGVAEVTHNNMRFSFTPVPHRAGSVSQQSLHFIVKQEVTLSNEVACSAFQQMSSEKPMLMPLTLQLTAPPVGDDPAVVLSCNLLKVAVSPGACHGCVMFNADGVRIRPDKDFQVVNHDTLGSGFLQLVDAWFHPLALSASRVDAQVQVHINQLPASDVRISRSQLPNQASVAGAADPPTLRFNEQGRISFSDLRCDAASHLFSPQGGQCPPLHAFVNLLLVSSSDHVLAPMSPLLSQVQLHLIITPSQRATSLQLHRVNGVGAQNIASAPTTRLAAAAAAAAFRTLEFLATVGEEVELEFVCFNERGESLSPKQVLAQLAPTAARDVGLSSAASSNISSSDATGSGNTSNSAMEDDEPVIAAASRGKRGREVTSALALSPSASKRQAARSSNDVTLTISGLEQADDSDATFTLSLADLADKWIIRGLSVPKQVSKPLACEVRIQLTVCVEATAAASALVDPLPLIPFILQPLYGPIQRMEAQLSASVANGASNVCVLKFFDRYGNHVSPPDPSDLSITLDVKQAPSELMQRRANARAQDKEAAGGAQPMELIDEGDSSALPVAASAAVSSSAATASSVAAVRFAKMTLLPDSVRRVATKHNTSSLTCDVVFDGVVGSYRVLVAVASTENTFPMCESRCDVRLDGGAACQLKVVPMEGESFGSVFSRDVTPAMLVHVCDAAGNYLATPGGKVQMTGAAIKLEEVVVAHNVATARFKPQALVFPRPVGVQGYPAATFKFVWVGQNGAAKALTIQSAELKLDVLPLPHFLRELRLVPVVPIASRPQMLDRTTSLVRLEVQVAFDNPLEQIPIDSSLLKPTITDGKKDIVIPGVVMAFNRQSCEPMEGALALAGQPPAAVAANSLFLELSGMDLAHFQLGTCLRFGVAWSSASIDSAHRDSLRPNERDMKQHVEYVVSSQPRAVRVHTGGAGPAGHGVDWQQRVWQLQLVDSDGDAIPRSALSSPEEMLRALRIEVRGSSPVPVTIAKHALLDSLYPFEVSQLKPVRAVDGPVDELRFFFAAPFDQIADMTVTFQVVPPIPTPFQCPLIRSWRQQLELTRKQEFDLNKQLRVCEQWLQQHEQLFQPRVSNQSPWELQLWRQRLTQKQAELFVGGQKPSLPALPQGLAALARHDPVAPYRGRLCDSLPPLHSISASRALCVVAGSLLNAHVFDGRDEDAASACGQLLRAGPGPTAMYLNQLTLNEPLANGLWLQFGGYSLFHCVWQRMAMHLQSTDVNHQVAMKTALIRALGSVIVFPSLADGSNYAKHSAAQKIRASPIYGCKEERTIQGGVEHTRDGGGPAYSVGVCTDDNWRELCTIRNNIRLVQEAEGRAAESQRLRSQLQQMASTAQSIQQLIQEHGKQLCSPERCIQEM